MFSSYKRKQNENIGVMWCPHCSAGMEPIVEPKIEILVYRCWTCGERLYPRFKTLSASYRWTPGNETTCVRCDKPMVVDEKGHKKCRQCLDALRKDYGEDHCIICGELFTKHVPWQKTCKTRECVRGKIKNITKEISR